jgi:predicted amidophosphoribosyltransferase
VSHKERGRSGLAPPLGAALARAVLAAARHEGDRHGTGPPILLVPVPSSRASIRRRGRDPTLMIVRAAAGVAGRRTDCEPMRAPRRVLCLPALEHRRRVADQAGLNAAERAANLSGALRARFDLRGSRVIVVDDVITTGATLAEATRALRAAGADARAAAVIAATTRQARVSLGRPDRRSS